MWDVERRSHPGAADRPHRATSTASRRHPTGGRCTPRASTQSSRCGTSRVTGGWTVASRPGRSWTIDDGSTKGLAVSPDGEHRRHHAGRTGASTWSKRARWQVRRSAQVLDGAALAAAYLRRREAARGGRRRATGCSCATRARSPRCASCETPPGGFVQGLAISPDGRRIAAGAFIHRRERLRPAADLGPSHRQAGRADRSRSRRRSGLQPRQPALGRGGDRGRVGGVRGTGRPQAGDAPDRRLRPVGGLQPDRRPARARPVRRQRAPAVDHVVQAGRPQARGPPRTDHGARVLARRAPTAHRRRRRDRCACGMPRRASRSARCWRSSRTPTSPPGSRAAART